MYTEEEKNFYSNPLMERVLRAVPMLGWRRCHDCEYVDLYRDNTLPICKCCICGSPDTRAMVKANKLLHRITD